MNKKEGKEYEQQQRTEENKKLHPERVPFINAMNEFIDNKMAEGMKLKEVSALFGFGSDTTLSNYRTGEKAPNLDTIKRISEVTGYDCDYLINGTRTEYLNVSHTTGLSDNSIKQLSQLSIGADIADMLNEFFDSKWDFAHEYILISNMAERILNSSDSFPYAIPDNYDFCTVEPEDFFRLHADKIGNCFTDAIVRWALRKAGIEINEEQTEETNLPF